MTTSDVGWKGWHASELESVGVSLQSAGGIGARTLGLEGIFGILA